MSNKKYTRKRSFDINSLKGKQERDTSIAISLSLVGYDDFLIGSSQPPFLLIIFLRVSGSKVFQLFFWEIM